MTDNIKQLELTVKDLQKTDIGIKQEILDIKEYLADREKFINKLASNFDSLKVEVLDFLTNRLSSFVTKEELEKILNDNQIDLSDYATKCYLKDMYYTKDEVDKLIPSVDGFARLNDILDSLKLGDYALKDYVDENFLKKSDLSLDGFLTDSDLCPIKKQISSIIDELENLKKKFGDYATKSDITKAINDLLKRITEIYIPNALEQFFYSKNIMTRSEIYNLFVTKEYLEQVINNELGDVDLIGYAKLSDLEKYALKSDIEDFVHNDDFIKKYLSIIENINIIKNSFSNYVKISEMSNYITNVEFEERISDFVTEEHLQEELAKLVFSGTDVDISLFAKKDELDRLKGYVNNELDKRPKFKDVYTRGHIDNTFYTKDEIMENYFDKVESDERYLTKTDADKKYLTILNAYKYFLTKEEYNGITDAMILSSEYKNKETLFFELLEMGSIPDGFYVVGDRVIVVKDGIPYDTDSSGSGSYTKIEIDEMLKNLKGMKWVWNEGGGY